MVGKNKQQPSHKSVEKCGDNGGEALLGLWNMVSIKNVKCMSHSKMIKRHTVGFVQNSNFYTLFYMSIYLVE